MRDILLTLIIAGLVPFAIRRPEVGVYAWVWLSMMNPHKLTYGFANTLPFALLFAIITLVGVLFSSRRKPLPVNGGTLLLLALIAWTTVTSVFTINDSQLVWERWLFFFKIQVMLLVTLMLLRGRDQIERLIWVIVFSIGFYGVKGGLWTVATGGGGRVWGPPGGMIQDNNSLGVGLILIMPLMYYLYQITAKRWIRWSLVASMVFTAFAILGTQSRGALLALLAIAIVLGLKGKNPVRFSLVLGILGALVITFMPDTWTSRMDTIQTYNADSSAMSRLYTWNTLWNVAVARPWVGAGFAADNSMVFALYAPTGSQFEPFQGMVFVAHSIYFQALGEHGFPGLLLFSLLGLWIWRAAGQTAKRARSDLELARWVPLLMRMCQVSTLGFAVGGAFLSLMSFDLPYYVFAIVVLTQAAVKEHFKSLSNPPARDAPLPSNARDLQYVVPGQPTA